MDNFGSILEHTIDKDCGNSSDEENIKPIIYSLSSSDSVEESSHISHSAVSSSTLSLHKSASPDKYDSRNEISSVSESLVATVPDTISDVRSPLPVVQSASPQTPWFTSWTRNCYSDKNCPVPSSPATLPAQPTVDVVTPSNSKKQGCLGGVKMPIAGVALEFPHEPYPVQKYMMHELLLAIKMAKHCLLESPTGTGKTLALLCSTLAWQQQEEELLQKLKATASDLNNDKSNGAKENTSLATEKREKASSRKTITPMETGPNLSDSDNEDIFQVPKRKKKNLDSKEFLVKPDSNETREELDKCSEMKSHNEIEQKIDEATSEPSRPPKIFYGTRTHKQITQVVEQLKKTIYGNKVKMTILAARDHTCVNNQVRNQTNITEQCQALIHPIKGEGCSYYTGSSKITSYQSLKSCSLPTVYDIEDIVKVGKKQKFCPYFTLRNLVVQSDIIFCPYNYLIDPIIRESMNINLAKSIVIMDEAHNIEDSCREAGSLWLKQTELEEAITECEENVKDGTNPREYANIKDFLVILDSWLSNNGPDIQYSAANESVTSTTGKDLINWLDIDGITQDKFQLLKESVNGINVAKTDNPDENEPLSGKVKQITSAIILVLNYLFKPENTGKYHAYFFREVLQKKPPPSSAGSWLSNHRRRSTDRVWHFSLHVICLSPAIVFSELLDARSIVLASGTLSPLDTFQSELGVDFPHVVKGWHVVPRQNLFVSAVASGPQRVNLKGVYENVNKYEYQDELGQAILETAKIVPHGVLCFFPSYFLMDKLKERWLSTGLLGELGHVKEMFWEPRRKQEMSRTMDDFTERIELSLGNPGEEVGAIMFGVFRGKIAEGIDFNDDNARAVIAVGIPFMNMHSKEISLKIKYNDENVNQNLLPGYRWYRIQAYRALNQALGRCIRHRKDWGAVILMDARMCSADTQANLPKWIQQQLQPFQSWENYLRNLSAFCNRMAETQKVTAAVPGTSIADP